MSGETPRRTFRCPDGRWQAAAAVAYERGESLTDVLNRALTAYATEQPWNV